MNNIPTMLTVREAAKKTGISERYLRQLCREDKIVYVQCGVKSLINLEKLIEFLNQGEQQQDGISNFG